MQSNLFHEETEVDDERAREHEMDLTPAPLVRQMLEVLRSDFLGAGHVALLDPCAGAGVFGQETRRAWREGICQVYAIELRREESPNVRRNYDFCHFGDCIEVLEGGMSADTPPPTAIVTNPAFSIALDLVPLTLGVVHPRGLVCFLQLDDFGQRSKDGLRVFDEFPPTHQFRIPGSVKFRNGINPETGKKYTADLRSYSWWLWDMATYTPLDKQWHCENLPRLEAKDRQWTTRPGEDWKMKL